MALSRNAQTDDDSLGDLNKHDLLLFLENTSVFVTRFVDNLIYLLMRRNKANKKLATCANNDEICQAQTGEVDPNIISKPQGQKRKERDNDFNDNRNGSIKHGTHTNQPRCLLR